MSATKKQWNAREQTVLEYVDSILEFLREPLRKSYMSYIDKMVIPNHPKSKLIEFDPPDITFESEAKNDRGKKLPTFHFSLNSDG